MAIVDYLRNVGRAIKGTSPRADHPGASTGRRMALWMPGNQSVNAMIAGSGETLVNRSRDIVRRNAWASEIKEEWVANAVGDGILPEFLHQADNVRRILEEGWKRFADECDAEGRLDIYGLQSLACGEMIEGAESITRIRPRRPEDRLIAPIQLQMLQSEFLPLNETMDAPNGNPIRMGIEFNRYVPSRREAYHIYREHPGAGVTAREFNTGTTVRVPANAIVHAYRMIQAGQLRGEPWLSRALTRLYQFDQFVDATLGRQKLGAFMFGWVETAGEPFEGTTTTTAGSNTAPEGTKFLAIEPETITKIDPGEKLEFFKQPDISTQYEQFIAAQLREIFACAGMTLEQFDVSKVNFSSIRQGALKFRRRCQQFQFQTLAFQFCSPILRAWMDAYVMFGGAERVADRLGVARIDLADYAANRREYQDVEWRMPRWDWVDPLKDVLAVIAEIRAGLKPLSAAIRERGYNPLEILRQYAADKELLDQYDLVFDTSSGVVTSKGQASALEETRDGSEPPLTERERELAKLILQ